MLPDLARLPEEPWEFFLTGEGGSALQQLGSNSAV